MHACVCMFVCVYVCVCVCVCVCTMHIIVLFCYRIQNSTSIPPVSYVFPNGYNLGLTVDRFKLTEALFDASSHNLKVTKLATLDTRIQYDSCEITFKE